MIVVVDYHAGNLTSVETALKRLGYEAVISSDPGVVIGADRIIFPGVGAAGSAMRNMNDLGLVPSLKHVIEQGRPFLGICLGFQVLFTHSEEDDTQCLGVVPGEVKRFPADLGEFEGGRALKVPQMGWNRADFTGNHPVWRGVPEGSEFYFVHSFYAVPAQAEVTRARTNYGITFATGVARGNVVAFQFHPEKSGRAGLRLLDNFCRWKPLC